MKAGWRGGVKLAGDQVARGLENLTVGATTLIESLRSQIQTERS